MNQSAKIVIASVLKPVDDVRNYHKLAKSIQSISKVEVHVFGSRSSQQTDSRFLHAWKNFNRLSIGRLSIQWQFWKKVSQLKPDILIITTFELLVPACCYKILFRKTLLYDVQEDYFKNLWHQQFYPPLIRHVLAIGIRIYEWLLRPFVSHYFLAEECYADEIGFVKGKSTAVPNKSFEIKKSPPSAHCR